MSRPTQGETNRKNTSHQIQQEFERRGIGAEYHPVLGPDLSGVIAYLDKKPRRQRQVWITVDDAGSCGVRMSGWYDLPQGADVRNYDIGIIPVLFHMDSSTPRLVETFVDRVLAESDASNVIIPITLRPKSADPIPINGLSTVGELIDGYSTHPFHRPYEALLVFILKKMGTVSYNGVEWSAFLGCKLAQSIPAPDRAPRYDADGVPVVYPDAATIRLPYFVEQFRREHSS